MLRVGADGDDQPGVEGFGVGGVDVERLDLASWGVVIRLLKMV